MNTRGRVAKNSIALVSVIILERSIGFLLPWYIARTLGASAMGEYSIALSWLFIASPFAIWGFDLFLLREISKDRSKLLQLTTDAALVTVGSIAITSTFLGIIVSFFNYPPSITHLLWLIALFVLPLNTWSLLLEATIKGIERMEWIAGIRIPLTLLRVAISLFLISMGISLGAIFLLLGVYYGITCLVYYVILRTFAPAPTRNGSFQKVFRLIPQAFPLAMIGVLGVTFKQVDKVILSGFATVEDVGVYSTGAMVIGVILLLAPAAMESIFPSLTRIHSSSPQRMPEIITQLMRLVWFFSVPITFIVISTAEPMIHLLFSESYSDSVQIAQILAIAIVPAFLSRLLYRILLASNNERLTLRIAAVNSIIGIGLNLALIARLGLLGAAIAVVSIEVIGFLQNLFFVNDQVAHIRFWQPLALPFICAMISGGILWYLSDWSKTVALLAAILAFWGISFRSGLVSKKDLVGSVS